MNSRGMGVAHIVAADMGYGHERPAHSLRHLAPSGEGIVVANNYPGIPSKDRTLWRRSREFYETVSRSRSVPLIGKYLFELVDAAQAIPPFYPRRDLSRPTLQLRQMYAGIRAGLGRHLMEKLAQNPLPLVCTFFYVAFMAEEYGYPGDIWCVTTDADISRAWAPLYPSKSRIRYFAANGRCVERLKLYGVRPENIFLTGFPLPPEIVDGPSGRLLRQDLLRRLCVLDPQGIFRAHHAPAISAHLGAGACPLGRSRRVPHVMFAVGGAGAQASLALVVLRSLAGLVRRGALTLTLMAGARPALGARFEEEAKRLRLGSSLGKTLFVRAYKTRRGYFDDFVGRIRETDILWTKPSELSFYTGLGLPILMAPPLGSQEEYNREWLSQVGGGVFQADPVYTHEWLMDWISSGAFARMAWNGYTEAPTHGTYRIENALAGKRTEVETLPLIV
ncbi:hypothetical protein HYW18_00375 [Candidatus Uhrbacteria bacterium]|nr:hypothetical protein [Candidatus Uhrbacteria bacterium]